MNILDQIVADKRLEVAHREKLFPISYWEQSPLFERPTHSLRAQLKADKIGIIAEHKRRSPSKAVIKQTESVAHVATAYTEAGASGLSILTDGKYFGGSLDDLVQARAATDLALLRKEFIVTPYQLIEAKAHGADAVLLIAAVLSKKEIQTLSQQAQDLQLEVLLEVHNQDELDKALMPSLDLIGVNNRNLKTFAVGLETSMELAPYIPDEFVKVSESGISDPTAVRNLHSYGYQGFLIGEHFMKGADIQGETAKFIAACRASN